MVCIRQIETSVPVTSYSQSDIALQMKRWLKDESTHRYIDSIYTNSGIETRHSVTTNLLDECSNGFFQSDKFGNKLPPSTGRRNKLFSMACRNLAIEVAKAAVENCSGIELSDVTHLITVSCTGFYSPGPDFEIITALGLSEGVQRYNLGFMGCYAAFPALKMAEQFCKAHEDAVVLIVCVELCTLHIKLGQDLDSIIANSVFADGAAAAIVTRHKPRTGYFLELQNFCSSILPEGNTDMAWNIGDQGFEMVLSKYVPRIIGSNIAGLMAEILSNFQTCYTDISTWAIHPGGKSIIDKIQRQLKLREQQVKQSRHILREYGNMSSATILFVLKEILRSSPIHEEKVLAMAFGPGLTIESSIMQVQCADHKALNSQKDTLELTSQCSDIILQ